MTSAGRLRSDVGVYPQHEGHGGQGVGVTGGTLSASSFPLVATLAHVILPLGVGILVYLGYRPRTLLVFDWLAAMSMSFVGEALRSLGRQIALPEWMIFVLPGALWSYSLTACMALLWRDKPRSSPWVLSALPLGAGSEILQAMGLMPGTFDARDLISYLVSVPLAFLFTHAHLRMRRSRP